MNTLNSLKSRKIPSGWRLLPVGKVLLDSQYGTNEPAVDGGNTRVLGMKNIQKGKVITDNLISVNLPEQERIKYLLHRGDLLLNRTNSYDLVGKVGIFNSDEEIVFASYLVRLVVNTNQVLPEYLNYWLNSHISQTTIKRIATRAVSQTNINPTEFRKHCFVLLPPISEQKVVTSILSNCDLAIDKTEQMIAAKDKQKQSLMELFLTGKLRLKGYSRPWVEVHLGRIFKERRERASDHLPLLSITREDGVIPRNENRKDTSSEDKSNYLRICPGDIGYNTMRMWQGVSALSLLDGIVSPAYTVCVPEKEVDGEFMAYLFKHPRIINLFYRFSQGLTSDTWNLKYYNFQKIRVTIPAAVDEQKTIAYILRACDEEIGLLKKSLSCLQQEKHGLMQKLLTGEWPVQVDKEAEQ